MKATFRPSDGEGPAQPARLGVERGERDAGDRGGQREGQVDERVHDPPAGEAVAHEHPGHDEAEDGVDERGGERRAEGEPVGGEHAGRGRRVPRGPPTRRTRALRARAASGMSTTRHR